MGGGFGVVFTRVSIYVVCVWFCNGEGEGGSPGKPQKMLASQDPSPIAKLDTRHINRNPRKDHSKAGVVILLDLVRLWIGQQKSTVGKCPTNIFKK